MPLLVATSLLWTAWDPTYASFRKAQLQGRDIRIQGKQTYIVSFHGRLPVIIFLYCLEGIPNGSLDFSLHRIHHNGFALVSSGLGTFSQGSPIQILPYKSVNRACRK